jgi:formylmethanofuran dehydrogenase subunit E
MNKTIGSEQALPNPITKKNQDLQAMLEHSGEMHRHICPRQVLGARMGILAGQTLSLELPRTDKRLLVLTETDGCFADGLSVATGSWLGRRTMRLMDYGKVAATFIDTHSSLAIRIAPHTHARANAKALFPHLSKWSAYLEGYKVLPDDQLLVVQAVNLTFSLEKLLSHAGARVKCAVCSEEILNGREVIQEDKVLCQSCAGDSYWTGSKPA